jgi:hypothetical protein
MERATEAFCRGAFCTDSDFAEFLDFDESPVLPEWAAVAAVEAVRLD